MNFPHSHFVFHLLTINVGYFIITYQETNLLKMYNLIFLGCYKYFKLMLPFEFK